MKNEVNKEESNYRKKMIVLMIICVILSIITLGIFIYDKFLKKEEEHPILKPINEKYENNDNNEEQYEKYFKNFHGLQKLFSLIPIKLDANGKFMSYTVSDLTDYDINSALCEFINYNYRKNNYMVEIKEVKNIIKSFFGIDNYQINVEEGNRYSELERLKIVKNNGVEYLKLENIVATDSFTLFFYNEITDLKYDFENMKLVLEMKVYSSDDSPFEEIYGTAKIYFDLKDGITLEKVDIKNEKVITLDWENNIIDD